MKRQSSQTRPIQRHCTAKEKAGLLQAHRRSGLSLRAFARKGGLCYASLLRWRYRQSQAASVLAPPDTGANPHFVPVRLEGEEGGGQYVLSWPTGRSLRIPRQFETDSLRRLLMVLEGWR